MQVLTICLSRRAQVTYPYIMAKTRLQAGDDDEDDDTTWEARHAKGKPKERYNGAIDCLQQVYSEEGFTGWYQVRPTFSQTSSL